MRISDWSSDVCSSDLPRHGPGDGQDAAAEGLCRWRVRRYGRRSCKGQPRSRSARQAGDACMTEPAPPPFGLSLSKPSAERSEAPSLSPNGFLDLPLDTRKANI